MMRATAHTQVGCPDPGEFLFTFSYLITNSMASTENLHVIVFSAQKLCPCPGVIQAGSGWWRGGVGDGAAGGSAAGHGHTGELLRPRFHMLCRLQLPED